MSNKLAFTCNACGCSGSIKVDDDHEIEVCPSCGNSLDVEVEDEEDFE